MWNAAYGRNSSPPCRGRRIDGIVTAPATDAARRRHRKAILMLLVATLFWGISFPTVKALALEQARLVPGVSTWFYALTVAVYRFALAGLLLAGLLQRRLGRLTRLEVEQGCWLAVFGGGGILFQMDGLSHTDASVSAFLTELYAAFIPIWVAVTRRRWPAFPVVLSVGLVLAGLAILSGLDWRSFHLGRGEMETLIGSFFFGGQILLLEQPRYARNDPLRFSVIMFLALALLCVPGVWLTMPNVAAVWGVFASPPAAGFLAVLVFVCTLGGYLFMNRWQPDVTATEAGLIYCLEPVVASALALFLPGWFSVWSGVDYANEALTMRLLLGGGLVTAANMVLQKRGGHDLPAPPPDAR